jgi:hypothetical protein
LCFSAVHSLRLYPLLVSILFHHHYLNLTECIKQVEQIKARVNKRLMKEEGKEEEPTTLDGYLVNKIAES